MRKLPPGSAGIMLKKLKALLVKYREIIVYLIVGVMTTVVSWAASFVFKLFLDPEIVWQNFVINSGGWVISVCFAYPLNRILVFRSRNANVLKEFAGFVASRLSTWLLDILVMALTVNLLHMEYWIAKIFISTVLVTVLNYVISKLLIFRSSKEK